MPKRQRGSDSILEDVEPDLRILVHDREEPLLAHERVLGLFSRCVRNLPKNADGGATVWDLRQLVPEGSSTPVGGELVQRYLDLAYHRVDSTHRFEVPRIIDDARPLLMLADAVDSTSTLFQHLEEVLLRQVTGLCLAIHVEDGFTVKLRLCERVYTLSESGLREWKIPNDDTHIMMPTPADRQFEARHVEMIEEATCSTLEGWMFLAGRLQMTGLMRVLVRFAKAQTVPLGYGVLAAVGFRRLFSPRVLQCMPRELLLEAFVRDCLTDLPSRIKLEGKGVTASVASSADFSILVGPGPGTPVVLVGGAASLIQNTAGASMPLHVIHGGFQRLHTRDAVIKDVVEKATVDNA
ncbi:hypothetical protein GPECTOR_112g276 [Gonium pectorale]|uniref:Uncharacterized protein n=1 Tax=Gonium pectorale TaxID=33097 RepID=A0A150FZ60_GONPE|nr:hypothetical protein GPECTOR_112g276 [Gonium pectorale]|eukprot:KXZ42906.1 hypothetical protein GPECTOR_112g276 [Gonium pectorale]